MNTTIADRSNFKKLLISTVFSGKNLYRVKRLYYREFPDIKRIRDSIRDDSDLISRELKRALIRMQFKRYMKKEINDSYNIMISGRN